jgi:hypothetical protein
VNKRCIKYKDVWAAPGSQLHEALLAGDMKVVERLYQEGLVAAKKIMDRAIAQSIAPVRK